MTAGGLRDHGNHWDCNGDDHSFKPSFQPDELGSAIAVAFLATLYGIASANILWIPFASKIKIRIKKEILLMEMILEGVLAIQVGENPRLLKEKLSIFLPPDAIQATRSPGRTMSSPFRPRPKPVESVRKEARM